jgi:imidazolonepropionase-like amidohydrolase
MHEAGVNVVVNSDSVTPGVCRYLFLDVGKVLRYTDLPEEEVLKMITLNPAKALEMDHLVGTLEVGKDGDLAVFDKHPLDSTTKCVMTIIEGEIYFDYDRDSLTAEGGSHE